MSCNTKVLLINKILITSDSDLKINAFIFDSNKKIVLKLKCVLGIHF